MIIEARAKINLALHVVGQRDDGYHLLDTLVTFADIADALEFAEAQSSSLAVNGPEASSQLENTDNLVCRAAQLLSQEVGHNDLHAKITLTKNLPVASGIGGGSADAAAALFALNDLWRLDLSDASLNRLALQLGADVPMCLAGYPLMARGIGDRIKPVPMPSFPLVLVNPRIGVLTADVFRAMKEKNNSGLPELPDTVNPESWFSWLCETRNDLQDPACELAPEISKCLSVLKDHGAGFARMSGSGATCFGLFENPSDAKQAEEKIANHHHEWWIASGRTSEANKCP